jgi:catechol 2,3-dioxygenase-like lactoylglutathione lyase family enzyme
MQYGQVHHIEYYVNDLPRSNLFWSWFLAELGYRKTSESKTHVSWAHATGTYLVFVQVADEYLRSKNSRQASGLNHIAFMGGTINELDQLQAQLVARQIRILKRDGSYLCFEDPNDFAVEVYAKDHEA